MNLTKKLLCLLMAMAVVLSMGMTGCKKNNGYAENTDGTAAATNPDPTVTNPAGTDATDATDATTGDITDDPTTPPANDPTTPPAGDTTDKPADQPVTPPTPNPDHWKDDGVLKILTIGNSFSVDCMQFVYEIAKAAGIEKVKLGNLYISGCSLSKHLTNAKSDAKAYTFYTNETGKWVTNNNCKLSTGIKYDNWDFISFQQASGSSGKADTYDTLNELLPIVEGHCTNPNVEFLWHMTWAYQGDSTHSSFPDYDSDQMTMYNAILDAVKTKIVPNSKFSRIIPNGTAVQNARTSYLGDTLTRDGYHMSKDKGRVLAGITVVATTVGIPWDTIDLSHVCSDANFVKVALESAKNAVATPFAVTQSAITKKEDSGNTVSTEITDPNIDPTKYDRVTLTLNKNAYYNSTKGTTLTSNNDTAAKFFATQTFTKETLPVGSIIVIADGWKYRPEAWKGTAKTSSAKRPAEVTTQMVTVTEDWWGEWTTRGFNIAKTNGGSLTNYTNDQINEVIQIYIPKK